MQSSDFGSSRSPKPFAHIHEPSSGETMETAETDEYSTSALDSPMPSLEVLGEEETAVGIPARFSPEIVLGELPAEYTDYNDSDHALLPCSPHASASDDGPLWPQLCSILSQPPIDVRRLMEMLCAIRGLVGGDWSVAAVSEVFAIHMEAQERAEWFEHVLPQMCQLALRMPLLFPDGLLLLRAGCARTVDLSAEQCGCLLVHAFFCTFRDRQQPFYVDGRCSMPYFTFINLHGPLHPAMNPTSVLSQVQLQKWRCFLCYFSTLAHRLAATPADPANARHVHFERLVADTSELDFSTWASDESPLCAVDARPDGLIEEAGAGALQLDFANKMVGGGVLRNGCVQEEIRFLISPELVVARLLAEKLADNEALRLVGFERFSSYSGYAKTFQFAGAYHEIGTSEGAASCMPEQLYTQLAVIDATNYGRAAHSRATQYTMDAVERELNKAFVGFSRASADSNDSSLSPICTGNWGCGAFGGDPQLKAVIQLLAASRARRPAMHYFTFGDAGFASSLQTLTRRLIRSGVTVGDLTRLLGAFLHTASQEDGLLRFLEDACDELEAQARADALAAPAESSLDVTSMRTSLSFSDGSSPSPAETGTVEFDAGR